ncbi:MAG: diguanylate cyclase [Deltaproteobacteria bacterium]
MEDHNKGKILIVDDDGFFRTLCSDILSAKGYSVKTASSGLEATKIIEKEPMDIVITDLVMPDIGGIEVLHRTKQHNILTDVVVITGFGSIESAIEALKSGASDYIRKPLNEDELLHTVQACMEKKNLLEENQEMRQSLRLFEVSRAVSGTIDINKLYNITIDALFQIINAESGIMVFFEEEGKKFEIKAIRHLGLNAGERIVGVFKENLDGFLKGLKETTILLPMEIRKGDRESVRQYNSFLLAPMLRGGDTIGFALFLSRHGADAYAHKDIKNAAFVAEHASLAFENAYRYAEAKEMAFIDSLTNLYNSKYLEMALDKEIKRADRMMTPVTLLFLDLDNFKLINDQNDHLVGSKVLVEVGKIILKCVREVDTVVRYGGDEFVVVLSDAAHEVAFRVAERIRSAIERHGFLTDEGLNIKATASIGIATYPIHTREKRELLKIADKAMYRAKDISRNCVYAAPLPEGAPAAQQKPRGRVL